MIVYNSDPEWYRGGDVNDAAPTAASGLLSGTHGGNGGRPMVFQRRGRPRETAVLVFHYVFKLCALFVYLFGGSYIATVIFVMLLLRYAVTQ